MQHLQQLDFGVTKMGLGSIFNINYSTMKKIFLLISFTALIAVSSFGQIRIDTALTTQGIGLTIDSGSVVTANVMFKSFPIDSSGTAKLEHEVHYNLDLFLNAAQAGKVGAKPLEGWISNFTKGFKKVLTQAEYNSIFNPISTGQTVDAGVIVMTWLKDMIEQSIGSGNAALIILTPTL